MNFIKDKGQLLGWIFMEGILYLLFLACDLSGRYGVSSYLKFISIVLCFAGTLFFQYKGKRDVYISGALGLSVFSDVFLLFTCYFVPGLLSFLCVQILFLIKLKNRYGFSMKRQVLYRGIVFLLLWQSLALAGVAVDMVFLLGACYIVFFAFNIGIAVRGFMNSQTLSSKKNISGTEQGLFMVGLILFFICDINVGIFNMSSYIQAGGGLWRQLIDISRIGMWAFYLPGQMLIGISSLVETDKMES